MTPEARITGDTLVCGVIGSPVRHSLSPVIFNAAFEAMRLDWRYFAFPVEARDVGAAIAAMRTLGLRGYSVTMPLKDAVVPHLDRLAPSAKQLGVVNSIQNNNGELVGHSTDGAGFVSSVKADTTLALADARCLIIGAGGASRSIVHALGEHGVASLTVANRTLARAESAASLGNADAMALDAPGLEELVESADLIVNTTSVGMGDDAATPINPAPLHDGQVLVDIIYKPAITALMAAAVERGAQAHNGVAMLVHQAVEQLRIWSGSEPPVEVMSAATAEALA